MHGEALTGVSSLAVLTCGTGVYSDAGNNVAASPNPFPALSGGSGQNSALGRDALLSNTTGGFNSAVGRGALYSNTTGQNNTAVGTHAMLRKTTGDDNTAVGFQALFGGNPGNTGEANTAVGFVALANNTTGHSNSAFGYGALGNNNTTGFENTALGRVALRDNTTGSTNIGIGDEAGSNLTTGNNNIDIANTGVAGESATTRIGTNGTQTRAFVAGIRGTTTDVADAIPVMIDSAGQLGTVSSSRRFKEDIRRMASASDPIMKLKPVTFRYRSNPSTLEYGLIAEQVAKVMPNLAVYGKDGHPETVKYQDLPVLLLNKVQQQQRQIRTLEARNHRLTDLQAQVDWLMSKVRGR